MFMLFLRIAAPEQLCFVNDLDAELLCLCQFAAGIVTGDNDTGFLSIMTTKCANKLYALNPLNGTGYALWMFWPQSIDDSAGAFIDRSIVPSGNGWFRVTTRHSNKTTVIRVRVIESNGDLKIDDVTEN